MTNPADASAWLLRFEPRPHARLRLFCFPYAGVGASTYRLWNSSLPTSVELVSVQYPGRETRLREPGIRSITGLVDALDRSIAGELEGRPFAFFGHSMGALVAFELTRRLRDSGRTLPAHLFVSARRAPHIPSFDSPISALPDAQFTQAIQERYNGIPAIILQDRDLLTFFLQVLRTDFAAIESYRFMPGAPLSCPVTVYGGTSDALADVPGLDEWKNLTSGPFSRQMFPGGHFYWQSNRLPLLDSITRTLDEHLD